MSPRHQATKRQPDREAVGVARAIRDHAAVTRPEPSAELDKREAKQRRIQWFMFVAAVIAAVFNFALWITQRDGTYKGLRAYVLPTKFELAFEPVKDQTEDFPVTVTIKNTGQTPAVNLKLRIRAFIHGPKDRVTSADGMAEVIGTATLGTQGEVSAIARLTEGEFERTVLPWFKPFPGTPASIARDMKELALLGAAGLRHLPDELVPHRFRVAGRISYYDVFGKERTTDFCAQRAIEGQKALWGACGFWDRVD